MGSMMCCARGPNGACSLTHTKPSEGETIENIAWRLGNIQTGRHGIVPYRFAARKVAPQNVACDDSSFYHAGIKNVVANISDWHPFKNQKTKYAYLLLSAWHVRPKYNGGRPPGLSNAARLSTFSNKKIETIIPGKEALTALRKTSVNKNSRTSSQDLTENFTQSSKKDLLEGSEKIFVQEPLEGFPCKLSYKHLLDLHANIF